MCLSLPNLRHLFLSGQRQTVAEFPALKLTSFFSDAPVKP